MSDTSANSMAATTTKRTRTFRLARFLTAMALAIAIAVSSSLLAYRVVSRYRAEQRWRNEMTQLGARVITAGYGTESRTLQRIPILREFFTRSQIELFVDQLATVDAVLAKAAEQPGLKRIWVDLTVFDRSMADRIEQQMPGMAVIFYTP